jgi:hypothetical protein
MDPITEQLSQLMELSDDQLAELERAVLDEFENSETEELSTTSVERLESLASAVESVRAEQSRRVTERQTLQTKAAEAAARIRGPEPEVQSTDGESTPSSTEPASSPEEPAPASAAAAAAPVTTAAAPGAPSDDITNQNPTDAVRDNQPDVQDQPPPQPEDNPAPIASDPNIVNQPVDGEKDVPKLSTNLATVPPGPLPPPDDTEDVTESPEMPGESPDAEDLTEPPENEQDQNRPFSANDGETTNTNNPEAPVTASAQGSEGSLVIEPPIDRRPKPTASATTLSITAGADIPSIGAGSKLENMYSVAEAFVKRLHTLRHVNGGDGEQHIVASLNYEFPEGRVLEAGDPQQNMDKIDKVAGPAIVAAAGICLPLETDYTMHCDVGVTDRPVRDSLARFAADRGGIRYYSSPQLTDFTNATGYWHGDANGANFHTYGPDGTTPTTPADQKPCLEVACPQERTAYIGAVTLCLTFNNLTGRVFPELVERQNELALVQHARIAENNLLRQLQGGSTAVTIPAGDVVLGAAREIFRLLARAVGTYRFKHRLSTATPLRMVVPDWVRELIRADISMQMPGDGLDNTMGVADAKINTWFRNAGVNVTWHLDGVGPTQDGTGFDFPDVVEFALFVEGTWLYLDGGTLDLGIIRDSSLVATNQYKQFVESFEGLANIGCESYWVEAPLQACGSAAALVETCAAATP